MENTKKIIGSTTTYHGTEHRYLIGCDVRIVGILKNAARADSNGDDIDNISDDNDLVRAGGITADDRVEVQPWIAKEGRFSFVTSDPKAIDLACFQDLCEDDSWDCDWNTP